MSLRLNFCSREAASFAVKAWHYSRTMPVGRLVCVGAWEAGAFVGAVVFGRGASSEIASPFGLQQSDVCELCRVALGPHQTPTSRIVSIAVRLLRQQSPGLRLIVSYADPEHGHHGGIYAAMNWLFIGTTNSESLIRLNGCLLHPRTVASRYRTRSIDLAARTRRRRRGAHPHVAEVPVHDAARRGHATTACASRAAVSEGSCSRTRPKHR